MYVFNYVFMTFSIVQSQFIEKGFKKAENSEQNGVLLLFLFTLDVRHILRVKFTSNVMHRIKV